MLAPGASSPPESKSSRDGNRSAMLIWTISSDKFARIEVLEGSVVDDIS